MADDNLLPITSSYTSLNKPHLSEWFGHRVFPAVSTSTLAIQDQMTKSCPFLTQTLGGPEGCVKQDNSKGVCTISALSNGSRQDWLVCPYRALDESLLNRMVRQLYRVQTETQITVVPAISLKAPDVRNKILADLSEAAEHKRAFAYFQDKLGGEIGLRKTPASPELSFDITIVELLPPVQQHAIDPDNIQATELRLGKYGVIELQTMDTHGSYKHAVGALTQALDLHPNDFHQQAASNPEWSGRKVEGPNISNVFKRTFYQIAFKFQVTSRDTSVGCILALPQPVWDSWQPFLGAPEIHKKEDGTWRLLNDTTDEPSNWIYVFDIDARPREDGGPAPIDVQLIIGTDARTLSRAALDVAPTKAVEYGGANDAVVLSLVRRLRSIVPGVTVIH